MQRNFPQGQRVYSIKGLASSICGQAGGLGGKTGLYCIPVLTPNRGEKHQNGRRFKNDGEPSFTLTGQDYHGIYDGKSIRRLTPTEGLRLQGFPDNYLEGSDTAKYKSIGNAVSVPIVKMIIERLYNPGGLKCQNPSKTFVIPTQEQPQKKQSRQSIYIWKKLKMECQR